MRPLAWYRKVQVLIPGKRTKRVFFMYEDQDSGQCEQRTAILEHYKVLGVNASLYRLIQNTQAGTDCLRVCIYQGGCRAPPLHFDFHKKIGMEDKTWIGIIRMRMVAY